MSDAPESNVSDNVLTGGYEPQSAATPEPEGQAPQESTTWFGGFSEGTQTLVTNQGLDKLEQGEAFESLATNYSNLQSKLGAPADELFRIRSDMGEDDWGKVYNAMGRPESVEGYSYKAQEGDSAELVEAFLKSGHELGLTDSQVSKMIPALNEKIQSIANGITQEKVNLHNESMEALNSKWGSGFDKNVNMATRAAEHFGMSQGMQEALHGAGLGAETLEFLAGLGAMMSEGQMAGMSPMDQKASIGAMTKAEAQAQLDKLNGDPDFLARLTSRDPKVSNEASKEQEKYYKILAS